jgi:hypothetical protein
MKGMGGARKPRLTTSTAGECQEDAGPSGRCRDDPGLFPHAHMLVVTAMGTVMFVSERFAQALTHLGGR